MNVFQYISQNWDLIGPQILTHLEIVGECIAITSVIGLVLGIAAARSEPLSTVIMAITSTILTVPSFALFGLLSIWFGLANPPVIIGLVLYGLLPVTRNTRAGIKTVDPAVVEAARGMGMNPRQILLKVELPLAVPVVLGGIRQATVMIVAIATVGAPGVTPLMTRVGVEPTTPGVAATACSARPNAANSAGVLILATSWSGPL